MTEDPTVFIVDDDNEVRSALALLMESIGMPVETFASAQAFLDQFNPLRSGCLVLD
ncbi:MAG TPA: response regulator, partial [Myxococcales bacterium]|nr:response regulator [Myxococcales bacterium]